GTSSSNIRHHPVAEGSVNLPGRGEVRPGLDGSKTITGWPWAMGGRPWSARPAALGGWGVGASLIAGGWFPYLAERAVASRLFTHSGAALPSSGRRSERRGGGHTTAGGRGRQTAGVEIHRRSA